MSTHDEGHIVAVHEPKSPAAEAFRTLRTNLQFAGLDEPIRSVMVTSAGPGEGKTTIAANLAVVMAQAGQQVLAIGGDLRRPMINRLFKAPNTVGITNVLTGNTPWQQAVQETDVPGLHLLLSGPIPPNPAELLASQRMKDLIQELEDQYDMLIVDAPPIMAVTDAGVMARSLDGVLLTVSVGLTPRDVAKAAKEQLALVGARVLGLVVNRVDQSAGYYYYDYLSDETSWGNKKRPFWRRSSRGKPGGVAVPGSPE